MTWLPLLAYFVGGFFLANAVPHMVSGLMGRPFPTPFSRPPGKGLSSPTVNALWGFFNAVAGYLLVAYVGSFDLKSVPDALALGGAVLLRSLLAARRHGQLFGSEAPAH